MPGSDGSQFISMRKYGAANNPSVSSLKRPGSNRLVLPKVSGTGLSREEFLPSLSKLNRNIPSVEILLTTAPSLTYTSGSTVSFPPLNGATNYKLYNNAGDALIADLGTNTSFSIPSLINPPANLAPNTPYTVYVVGSNSLGPSPKSSTITFTTPPAPPTMTISGNNLTIPSSTGATNYRLISSPPIVPPPTITPGTTSFSSLGLTPGTTYTLSVATTGANGIESLPGSTVTVYTPPNTPGTVSYGASTSSTAVVSWAPPSVGGVTGYNIYDGSTLYATVTGTTVTFGAISGKPALASGTTFTNFSVKAYYNTPTNESAAIPLSFSTLAGPPSQPSLTLGSKTTNSVSLNWAPASGSTPTGYILTQNGAPVTLSPVTLTSITISSGITAGTIYTYSLTAYAGPTTNTSPPASLVVYTTPNPTGTVTASSVTSTTSTLTWSAPSGGVTGYNIYNGAAIPANLYTTITNTSVVLGSGSLAPLTSGTSYTFNVKAYYNTTDNESTTQSVTFTTQTSINPPTNVQLTAQTNTTANLTWTPPTTGNKDGFIITTITPSGSSTTYTVSGASSTSYQITGLTPGTTYVWNIFTYFGTTSQRSTAVTVPTAFTDPAIPTSLAATPTVSGATLTWNPATLPINADIVGYKIYDSPGGTIPAYTIAKTSPLSQVITGLASNSTYTYYVASYGTRNSTSVESTTRASVTFTTSSTPAPTNGTADPKTDTAILSWVTSDLSLSGYNVYNGTTLYATLLGNLPVIDLGTGSYTPLAPATTYSFNVKAYYGTVATESSALNIIFTTFNTHPAPTNLTIASTTAGSATLTWTPVNGSYNGYFIRIFDNSNQNNIQYFTASGVGTSTFTATVLAGKAIFADIRTYTGNPTLSNNPTVNNPLLGYSLNESDVIVTVPAAPTNPVVSGITGTGATLTWTPTTTPTGVNSRVYRYNIYDGSTLLTYENAPNNLIDLAGFLTPSTTYTINVKAVAEGLPGFSLPDVESAPLAFTFTTPIALTRVAGFPIPINDIRSPTNISSDETGQYVIMVDESRSGGNGLIWISKDYGATWRKDLTLATPPTSNFKWAACSVSKDGNIAVIVNKDTGNFGAYVCTTFKSQVAGTGSCSWDRLGASGTPGDNVRFNSVKISGNGNKIYAVSTGSSGRAYVSTYSGGVWGNLVTFGTLTRDNWGAISCSFDGSYVYAGYSGGSNKTPYRYAVGTSTDWELIDASPLNYTTSSIACSDNGAIVYIMGTESYIRASTNYGIQGSWTTLDYTTESRRSIVCSSDGSILLAVGAETGQITKIINQNTATLTRSLPPDAIDSLQVPVNTTGVFITCSGDATKLVMVSGNSKVFKSS
jgi:hypothetical protein